jgi:uncharacterized damage-inducible protein DinB
MEPLAEPDQQLRDPAELLAGYLDYFRDGVLRKLDGMSDEELRRSRLPSGWTPLQLLKHLSYVELRWLQWGFMGEQVALPWGDHGPDDEWHMEPGESVAEAKEFFLAQCSRSREIVAGAELADRAAVGGRFSSVEEAPTLVWILFHVLQEYARHLGHLDIVRELADGVVGE